MYHQKHHQFKTFYNHKFGFHISGPQREAYSEALRLRPKLLKTLDFSVDFLSQVRREQPDTFLIGRLFVHPQNFGRTASDAQHRGVDLAERILRLEVSRHTVAGQPILNAWESLNEVLPEDAPADRHKLYDEFQVAFGRRLRSAGFEPVGFNFATGNGRGEQWLRLYPGTLETYTYLGFHEYDWPELDRLHRLGLAGADELHHRVPAVGAGQGNDGMWRCLRYRRIMHEGIRQKYGDRHTVIITECGMTQGVWGGASKDIGPWAKELTVPRHVPGGVAPTPIPADDYWRSLQWYNRELMRDDYVMGACLFVTGAGSHEWETFEHVPVITTRIFAFQQEINLETTHPHPGQPDPRGPHSDRAPASEGPPVDHPDLPEQPQSDVRLEPDVGPPAAPPPAHWRYTLKTGAGMGLLVGDIGLQYESILITKPDGRTEQLISGHKPEYGLGGFETYAQQPGRYRLEFLDQQFELELDGRFTRIIFEPVPPDKSLPPPSERPDLPTEIIDPKPVADLPPEGVEPPPEELVSPAEPPFEEPVPAGPESSTWRYEIHIGSGLGLLVGDLGLPREPIRITKPDGRTEQVISGHKPEFGVGGFETYALKAGPYRLEFLDQVFTLILSGQFTRVTFERIAAAPSETPVPSPGAEVSPTPAPQPAPEPVPIPPSVTPKPAEPTPATPEPPAAPSATQPAPEPIPTPPSAMPELAEPSPPEPEIVVSPPRIDAPAVPLPPAAPHPETPAKPPLPHPPHRLGQSAINNEQLTTNNEQLTSLSPQPSTPPPLHSSTLPPFHPSTANLDWTYTLQLGSGLGRLVGDLGLADVPITVIRPDKRREQVISGSKPEHGVGGFELEAWEPGTYTLEFLGRRFHLNLLGRLTCVTFRRVPQPIGALTDLSPAARDPGPLLVIRGEEEISPEVQSQRSFFNSLLTILARWLGQRKSAGE